MTAARTHRLFGPLLLGTGLTTLVTAASGTTVIVKYITVSNTATVARVYHLQITPSGGTRDTVRDDVTGAQFTSQHLGYLGYVLQAADILHINAVGSGLVVAVFGSILTA